MEFALEMIVKSTINGLRVTEVPTALSPDGRGRPPHLRSWRDGWRSLRFFLMLSPEWLFLFPGLALFVVASGGASLALIVADIRIGSVIFTYHTLIMTSTFTMVGIQSVLFWVFAKSVAIQKKLLFPNSIFNKIRPLFSLEKCLVVGGLFIMTGLGVAFYALLYWYHRSFGKIDDEAFIKVVCSASFLTAVGFQVVFSSFFIYSVDQETKQHASLDLSSQK